MTPEEYQHLGQLYHQALEFPPLARAEFLEQACDGDSELRRRVEALLYAHEQAGEYLSAPDPALIPRQSRSVASCAPIASAGDRFGPYEVISLIGVGGMGEVYLAKDTRLDRDIALKLLPAGFTEDADRIRRFKQEARAASATNHPNIMTVFDIGEAVLENRHIHFIAVEYVEGRTLRERLNDSPVSIREALEIAAQTGSALAAAHEAGVVHRDIKPENIMIRRDGYVKVLDFGLAKLAERIVPGSFEQTSKARTNPGLVLGTFAYMSPEQAQGQEVDARSDLFSLGCVLYEMIGGQVPFHGDSPADVIAAIISRDSTPIKHLMPGIPAELDRIVVKLLAKDRANRFPRAQDLATALRNLALELEVESRLHAANPNANPTLPDIVSVTTLAPGSVVTEEMADLLAISSLLPAPKSGSSSIRKMLEPVGGAVALDSGFYVLRPTDGTFRQAVARRDSIVLVKGARQVGKTSLLARGLQQARAAGSSVVLTDFQTLSSESLKSMGSLMLELARAFGDQLDLDVAPDEVWKPNRGPGVNFEQYLRREVLLKVPSPIVWGLDEVDRLFTCNFGSEVFGLFRAWHNKRALDPEGPWLRLTLAIAYATEAHLFITDINQSPFNVGTRLQLEDFAIEQVRDLNERYGSPLKSEDEIERYYELLSGHPYLVRRGLHEMVANDIELARLETIAALDEGPFGDHLHRMLISLTKDAALCDVVRGVLLGKSCPSPESFYRLRSAGVAVGESTRSIKLRCKLYATYLETHLQ
ncbi:MAG: AAA-like domain-containing protein [Acidobacteriota bacterium]